MVKKIPTFKYRIKITRWRSHYRIWRPVEEKGKIYKRYVVRSSLEEAIKLARELEQEFRSSGVQMDLTLSPEEKMAIKGYRASQSTIPLSDWVIDGARKSFSNKSNFLVEEAVESFIRARKAEITAGTKRNETYMKNSFSYVEKFAQHFKGRKMFAVTDEEVIQWNRVVLTCSPKGKNHYLGAVKQLFSYCGLENVKEIKSLDAPEPKKEIYTVEEINKILKHNRPKLEKPETRVYAGIVLSLFCGLRQSESILYLTWEHINPAIEEDSEKSQFFLPEGKTGPRHVEMPLVAKEWLRIVPLERRRGAIFVTTRKKQQGIIDGFTAAIRHYLPKDVSYKKNALRHSWCTYYVSFHKNIEVAATLMGNTPRIVEKHYYRSVLEREAEEFWNLSPLTDGERIKKLLDRKKWDEKDRISDRYLSGLNKYIIDLCEEREKEKGSPLTPEEIEELIEDDIWLSKKSGLPIGYETKYDDNIPF